MNIKNAYLLLCVLGALLPLSQFVPWVLDHGLNIPLFISELFSTRIGAFFGFDVIVSAVVLIVFMISEQGRLKVRHLWLPILTTFSVGVSVGFPLYLYLRHLQIERAEANAGQSIL